MKTPIRRSIHRYGFLVVACFAVASGGCSDAFKKAWDLAPPAMDDSIAGRWQGTWTSEQSSHQGELKCVVTPRGDRHFDALFHATYGGMFCRTINVTMEAQHRDGDIWHYIGRKDLGWMCGGVFSCNGSVSPKKFFANYESNDDYGVIEMTRPPMPQPVTGQRRNRAYDNDRVMFARYQRSQR